MENVNEQKETMKNKISNFFEESSVPPTISATASVAIPLAVVNKYLKVYLPKPVSSTGDTQ